MPLSQVTSLLLLLSAACGGAVALIVAGIGLRLGGAGSGGDAGSGGGDGTLTAGPAGRGFIRGALDRTQPLTHVALQLVFLAFLAAIPKQQVRELLLLGAVAFFAVDALQASSGVFGLRHLARGRAWVLVAVQAAALVMASMWGDRLAPGDGAGRIYPFAVAAVMVLATTFLGLLPPRFRPVGPLAAAAIGSVAAWALSTFVLGASDLWQPATAGCALAAAISIILSLATPADEELPAPLALAITLTAAGAMLLIGRQFGMYGVSLAAIALLPLALTNLRIATLLSAIFAGRALLQWTLITVSMVSPGVGGAGAAGAAAAGAAGAAAAGAAGLDITQPYALAALVAGLVLAIAPSLAGPYLKTQAAQLSTLLALLALPPLAAVVVQASALPALLMGILAAAITLSPTTHRAIPTILIYTGGISALLAPRLATLTPLPTSWRLVALGVAVAVVTLAVVTAATSPASARSAASGVPSDK